MKIAAIVPWLVRVESSYWGEYLFVEVRTDEGLCGWGEITTTIKIGNRAVAGMLREHNELLVGNDPTKIESLWHKTFRAFTYRGSRGAASHAVCGVDIALWDILGKSRGLPVYEMLGGPVRDDVLIYTHPDQSKFTSREGVIEEIRAFLDSGHDAIKFDPFPHYEGLPGAGMAISTESFRLSEAQRARRLRRSECARLIPLRDKETALHALPEIKDISRPPRALVDALAKIGTATLASELERELGIRDPQIRGPQPLVKGRTIAGPALTLQCMPKREDLYTESEYEDPERQLHRHVLYPTQPGDVVVVDARGDLGSGIFGEMMLTFFAGRGGAGVVIDGCIRDSAEAAKLDIGIWVKGVTPNYHAQTNIIPFAVNVPIACANVLVIPGDIIVADDDGVVLVPVGLAPKLLEIAGKHVEWEEFSRTRLAQGGDLRKYYPLSPEGEAEYKDWRKAERERSAH